MRLGALQAASRVWRPWLPPCCQKGSSLLVESTDPGPQLLAFKSWCRHSLAVYTNSILYHGHDGGPAT